MHVKAKRSKSPKKVSPPPPKRSPKPGEMKLERLLQPEVPWHRESHAFVLLGLEPWGPGQVGRAWSPQAEAGSQPDQPGANWGCPSFPELETH